MKKLKANIMNKKIRDWGATILGVCVAIAMDLLIIDWKDFDLKKEWPKLVLSSIVALGGYFSRIKNVKKDDGGKAE